MEDRVEEYPVLSKFDIEKGSFFKKFSATTKFSILKIIESFNLDKLNN